MNSHEGLPANHKDSQHRQYDPKGGADTDPQNNVVQQLIFLRVNIFGARIVHRFVWETKMTMISIKLSVWL